MNSSKAIKIINDMKKRSESYHWNVQNSPFETYTKSMIDLLFGKDSHEHNYIFKFEFMVIGEINWTDENWNNMKNYRKRLLNQFFDNCIITIKHKGVFKEYKENAFKNLIFDNPKSVISAIVFCITASFFTGAHYSKQVKEGWSIVTGITTNNKP